MLRFLPMLLVLGLALVALIDCLSRDDDEIRGLPKVVWVFVVLLFPLLGSLAWFFAGRPRKTGTRPRWPAPGGKSGTGPARRPVAPDDDPDFLRSLDDKNPRADDDDPRR